MKTDLKPSPQSPNSMSFPLKYTRFHWKIIQITGTQLFFSRIIWCHMCLLPYCLRVSRVLCQNVGSPVIRGPMVWEKWRRWLLDWATVGEERTYRCQGHHIHTAALGEHLLCAKCVDISTYETGAPARRCKHPQTQSLSSRKPQFHQDSEL